MLVTLKEGFAVIDSSLDTSAKFGVQVYVSGWGNLQDHKRTPCSTEWPGTTTAEYKLLHKILTSVVLYKMSELWERPWLEESNVEKTMENYWISCVIFPLTTIEITEVKFKCKVAVWHKENAKRKQNFSWMSILKSEKIKYLLLHMYYHQVAVKYENVYCKTLH